MNKRELLYIKIIEIIHDDIYNKLIIKEILNHIGIINFELYYVKGRKYTKIYSYNYNRALIKKSDIAWYIILEEVYFSLIN